MFVILRPSVPIASSQSYCRPHRRHGRVKYRGGRYHRFHPHFLVGLDDVDNSGRWMPRRHCALRFTIPDLKDEKALSRPVDCPNVNTAVETSTAARTKILPTNSQQKASDSSTATKTIPSTDSATVSSRHEECGVNTILERTPVHREEVEESATISMDVSGFALDQLQVRLEEEEEKGTKSGRGRPILTVQGDRTNILGDKFKIHRRFLLDRDNLADINLQELAISANLSKQGILTICVPKKKRGTTEKEAAKVSRTIPVQQQPPPPQPSKNSNSLSGELSNETTTKDETKVST
jgi:HSP20 family molecular chaperone IbpA